MLRPLRDDGTSVILDLHGRSVDEARSMLEKTTALAVARGRSSVRVIHGVSTSDPHERNRTIKHLVEDMVNDGKLPHVVGTYTREGATILSLPITPLRDSRAITAFDVL